MKVSAFLTFVIGQIGPPMIAATLVVCLVQMRINWTHVVLFTIGLSLSALQYHRASMKH